MVQPCWKCTAGAKSSFQNSISSEKSKTWIRISMEFLTKKRCEDRPIGGENVIAVAKLSQVMPSRTCECLGPAGFQFGFHSIYSNLGIIHYGYVCIYIYVYIYIYVDIYIHIQYVKHIDTYGDTQILNTGKAVIDAVNPSVFTGFTQSPFKATCHSMFLGKIPMFYSMDWFNGKFTGNHGFYH